MRVLYHVFIANTIYAGRTIFNGYKNAFEDLGHTFRLISKNDNLDREVDEFKPDILFTFLGSKSFKFYNIPLFKKIRKRGIKVFVNLSYWNSPFSKLRINESSSLSKNKEVIKIIRSNNFGDVYYNACEQDDLRMEGFTETTGYNFYTIPLAADKLQHFPEYSSNFKADISYIGTNLPGKREFMRKNVFPLQKKYNLRIYGQDWNFKDKITGVIHKTACYLNIPFLNNIQKPMLQISDERKIYSSSIISINVHEDFQRKYGGECNERTFKILACGGFEICDDVACIKKYFKEGKEIIIAEDENDWREKIQYFIRNPDKRLSIIEAGKKRVLKDHTYHNRVEQFIRIYSK